MAKVTDVHIRRLFRLLGQGQTLSRAAQNSGVDQKTARRYWNMRRLPSEQVVPPREWRTRPDPFAEVWPELAALLEQAPGLQAKTLWGWLVQKYPARFDETQLRTLQRRVKAWRATQGPGQEVYFSQVHHPGRLCASDFTHMNRLNVTIGGQRFDHMVYHFVLTYSNWESVTLCFSESFESLSEGLQNALGELGGVPERHRSDRLSSAVNNLSERRDFTARYQALLAHYQLTGEKIQARAAHENGDAEASHRHFKEAVEQALLLRGSRDFASREQYTAFLAEVCRLRNANRSKRLAEESTALRPLPARRLETCRRLGVTVSSGSVIRVQNNVYSVNSRLIGERVEVRIYLDHLEVWYGQKLVEALPRLRGRCKQHVNYRHVIDALVRKPGALADYRYREGLFPTSRFRMAYDLLHETGPARADREYLEILHLAAHESEEAVEEALRVLMEREQPISRMAVEVLLRESQAAPVTAVSVAPVNLADFDKLLTEEWHEPEQGREGQFGRLSEGVASAVGASEFRGASTACREGDAVVRAVSLRVEPAGMRDPADPPDRAFAAPIPDSAGEGSAAFRLEAFAGEGGPPSAHADGRNLPGSTREHFGFWTIGFGEDASVVGLGPGTDPCRPQDLLLHVQSVSAGTTGSQARLEAKQSVEAPQRLRCLDHRRHRIRSTEPGGNGSVVHAVGGAVRTRQCVAHQQLAVRQVGSDLQGSDDDRGGHQSTRTPQRDPGTQHYQLPAGTGQESHRIGDELKRRGFATGTGRPREPWGFLIAAHGET